MIVYHNSSYFICYFFLHVCLVFNERCLAVAPTHPPPIGGDEDLGAQGGFRPTLRPSEAMFFLWLPDGVSDIRVSQRSDKKKG